MLLAGIDHDHRLDHHVGAASSRDGVHRNLSPTHIAAGSRSYSSSLFRGFFQGGRNDDQDPAIQPHSKPAVPQARIPAKSMRE
jgi:hypothetical protein